MIERNDMSLDTWVVAAGRTRQPGDPLNPPITAASNFIRGGDFYYSRSHGTPTIEALEHVVGGMEGGRAIAFSSGMAAVAAVFNGLTVGSSVVIGDDCYHGVAALALEGAERNRWSVKRLGLADTPAWCDAAGSADLVWLETPTNPLLDVADLAAICAAPRKPGNIIAVDNTFATPFNQRPLEFGADLAMHSATKFIGGHSDLLAGVLVTADSELEDQLLRSRELTGAIPGALETYLAVRGSRTMALRLDRGQASAGELALRLQASSAVDVVRYPGLASHATHEVAARVLDGFGAMISFDVAGDVERADAVVDRLELIMHATSLGGVESTIERRGVTAGQEHLPPTLLRFSVGCENVEDLWSDLEQALAIS